MTIKQPFIPCNDNSSYRWHFSDRDCSKDRYKLLEHIPRARALIKQYCKHSWKCTPNHCDYIFLEYQLCTLLERKDYNAGHQHAKLTAIAMVLEITPLALFNDPYFKVLTNPVHSA